MSGRALPWKPAALVGVGSFLLYSLTSPAGITWEHLGEDGAEFAAVGKVLGVAHPTGYPLYTLLARIASIGAHENAWRVQLLTNLCAGLAVALAFLFFWRLAGSRRDAAAETGAPAGPEGAADPVAVPGDAPARRGAFVGAALFALSPIWWAQSTIIEVYPLHLAFIAGLLFLALSPDGWPRRLLLLAWVGGLAMTHHLQAALVAPGLLILSIAALRRTGTFRAGPIVAAFLLAFLPLTLYAVLMIRSAHDPLLDWGNPETFDQLLWVLRGEQYRFRMFHDAAGVVAERARTTLFQTLPAQFGGSALALALVGLVALRRRGTAAAWWALVTGFLVQLAFHVNYDIPDPDAYTLPLTLLASAWCAVGAAALLSWGGDARDWRRSTGRWLLVALLVVPAVRLPELYRRTSLRHDRGSEEYSREALALAPRGSLLLTDGDGRSFGLWYRQVVEGRTDLTVAYRLLLNWPWYHENLARHDPALVLPPLGPLPGQSVAIVAGNLPHRPVYTTTVDPWLADSFAVAPEGRLFRVLGARQIVRPPHARPAWRPVDLSAAANADYRLSPFTPGGTDSTGLFRNFGGGRHFWGELPLQVARPRATTGAWPIIAMAGPAGTVVRLPLDPGPTRQLVLLADAWTGSWSLRLGEARILYDSGPADTVEIRSYVNVWDFHAETREVRMPEDLVVWHGPKDQSLAALPIPVDGTRRPVALELTAEGARAEDGTPAAYAIFAVSQLLADPEAPSGGAVAPPGRR